MYAMAFRVEHYITTFFSHFSKYRYLKSQEDARRESLQFRNECAHNEAIRQKDLQEQQLQQSIEDYVS